MSAEVAGPRPYEGITGTDRTGDDLLSLEDHATPRRLAHAETAECLYTAILVGDPAPIVKRMSDRILHPVPGDLVLETSTRGRTEDTRVKAFGILLARRYEPEAGEEVWYIQYGPSAHDICRWVNCDFRMVPRDHREFTHPLLAELGQEQQ